MKTKYEIVGFSLQYDVKLSTFSVADPGFPVGERGPRSGGCGLPRRLRFENFICQNERIGTLGGARRARPPRSANDFADMIRRCI